MAQDSLPPLRDVIARHQIKAKRGLGQNFLLDLNLTMKIARCAMPLADCTIVEIGPGPGGLTRALLAAGARRIVAIERDARVIPALEEISVHYPGRLEIVEGDALAMDIAELVIGDSDIKIVANLPYNIGTELLVAWLTAPAWPPFFRSLTLMFQREVAERIIARPGTHHYGRLSVLAGWRTEASIAMKIPAAAFTPAPKVESAVVHLVPRSHPLGCDRERLETVTRSAFGQRRKMLRQSLKSIGGERLLETTGIDGTRRAETLSIEEFVALANAM